MAATRKGPVAGQAGPERGTRSGDEPLLLADAAPTMVSADRPAGAKAIEATDASVIVMDDGFQNPSLAKDLSLIVVDAGVGPRQRPGHAGRALAGAARRADRARADALIVIGDGGKAAPLIKAFTAQAKPVLKARMVPRQDRRWLGVLPVIGFAGIARPGEILRHARATTGARLIDTRSFPTITATASGRRAAC